MKKKKTLKASFVITFAAGAAASAAALGASGCGSLVTTNPPMGDCPETQPTSGDDCDLDVVCEYQDECGLTATFQCSLGVWNGEWEGSCNPPILECPDTVPAFGDACVGIGTCQYTDECGQPVEASCPGDTWDVQYEGTCNPPAPCEYLGQDGCAADPTCVWHEPGCGEPESIPALGMAGCFSATPCATDADCPTGTCEQVMVLPDCAPGCDACGEAVFLCTPALL